MAGVRASRRRSADFMLVDEGSGTNLSAENAEKEWRSSEFSATDALEKSSRAGTAGSFSFRIENEGGSPVMDKAETFTERLTLAFKTLDSLMRGLVSQSPAADFMDEAVNLHGVKFSENQRGILSWGSFRGMVPCPKALDETTAANSRNGNADGSIECHHTESFRNSRRGRTVSGHERRAAFRLREAPGTAGAKLGSLIL